MDFYSYFLKSMYVNISNCDGLSLLEFLLVVLLLFGFGFLEMLSDILILVQALAMEIFILHHSFCLCFHIFIFYTVIVSVFIILVFSFTLLSWYLDILTNVEFPPSISFLRLCAYSAYFAYFDPYLGDCLTPKSSY